MTHNKAVATAESNLILGAAINCPLCQQLNQCAIANQQPSASCWCQRQAFVPKASLTVNVRRDACICQVCAAALMAEQQAGLKRID